MNVAFELARVRGLPVHLQVERIGVAVLKCIVIVFHGSCLEAVWLFLTPYRVEKM